MLPPINIANSTAEILTEPTTSPIEVPPVSGTAAKAAATIAALTNFDVLAVLDIFFCKITFYNNTLFA